MIDLEHPSAVTKLAELSEGVGFGNPREFVRAAGHGVYLQLRTASLDLVEADTAYQLLPAVSDPLVRSSFLSGYASALVLSARYDEALVAAREFVDVAEQYRLDFALPYALACVAMARSGARQWRAAEDAALSAIARAKTMKDINADLVSRAALLRLYAQQGQIAASLAVDVGRASGALNATVAELSASRALALACAGRTGEAREILDELHGTTSVIELAVLSPAVAAVCSLRDSHPDVIDRALHLEAIAFQTGGVDLLVTSYRACPELLVILLRASNGRRFRTLVELAGDHDLARVAGYPIVDNGDKRLLLTPRETEVFEMLRTGISNREIGRVLLYRGVHGEGTRSPDLRQARRSFAKCARRPSCPRTSRSSDVRHRLGLGFGLVVGALCKFSKVRASREPVLLFCAREDRLKSGYNTCVELTFDGLSQSQPRDSARHRVAIRPVRRHGVVCVCHGDDPSRQGECPHPLSHPGTPVHQFVRGGVGRSSRSPSTRPREQGCAPR